MSLASQPRDRPPSLPQPRRDHAELRARLEADGFVAVPDVLDPTTDLDPLLREYEAVLEGLVQRFVGDGTLRPDSVPPGTLSERLIAIHRALGVDLARHFDISLPLADIVDETPIHLGVAAYRLLTNASLLDLVETFVGPRVLLHPLQKVRMKLPADALPEGAGALIGRTPWHQDVGILEPEAEVTELLTAWIPLGRATAANGTLAVVPGSHRSGTLAHCPTGSGPATEIPARDLPERPAIPVEMAPGSVLILGRRTVHHALTNVTPDEVRLSLDLRYQPIGQPTGRPTTYPSFVVRDRAAGLGPPDYDEWRDTWLAARANLARAGQELYFRWPADHPACS